jgi:hypothetical protein
VIVFCGVPQNFGVSRRVLTKEFIATDVLVGGTGIFVAGDVTKSFLYWRLLTAVRLWHRQICGDWWDDDDGW